MNTNVKVNVKFRDNGQVVLFLNGQQVKVTDSVSEMINFLTSKGIDAEFETN